MKADKRSRSKNMAQNAIRASTKCLPRGKKKGGYTTIGLENDQVAPFYSILFISAAPLRSRQEVSRQSAFPTH